MKRVFGILVVVLLLCLGCGYGSSGDNTTWAEKHLIYTHDDVHNVGIWAIEATGNTAIR